MLKHISSSLTFRDLPQRMICIGYNGALIQWRLVRSNKGSANPYISWVPAQMAPLLHAQCGRDAATKINFRGTSIYWPRAVSELQPGHFYQMALLMRPHSTFIFNEQNRTSNILSQKQRGAVYSFHISCVLTNMNAPLRAHAIFVPSLARFPTIHFALHRKMRQRLRRTYADVLRSSYQWCAPGDHRVMFLGSNIHHVGAPRLR